MIGLEVNLQGATRKVYLTRKWAIKTPYFRWGWKNFLIGLLSNMQEVKFSNLSPDKLCPVRWHIPGGFLLVMPRVTVMTAEYFADSFDYETFVQKPDWTLPVESKWNSFGWMNGRIVAIDYGSIT